MFEREGLSRLLRVTTRPTDLYSPFIFTWHQPRGTRFQIYILQDIPLSQGRF